MTANSSAATATAKTRWLQLALGIVCMSMLANLQYGWTMFVRPMHERHDWSIAAIQVAFSIFIVTETWPQVAAGWVVDRYGPRLPVAFGGTLIGLSWVLNSYAESLTMLYVAAVVGGIGVCCVTASTFGNAFKWFPDKRGLAIGLTSAGFGAGAALTVVPIQYMIEADSYEAAFFYFGLLQGSVIFLCAWVMRAPKPGEAPPPRDHLVKMVADSTPPQMLRSGIFWIVLVMFLFASIGGLMATAQLGPIARDYGIDKMPVSLFGLTLPALVFALSIDRVLNGITRPFFGFVSDHIGRENTLFIAFGLEALGIWALGAFGKDPLLFVLLSGCVFFAWGEIYTVFAALLTDIFGTRHAATNYGILYCGKGIAALLVPFGNVLASYTGSWHSVFYAAAVMNALTALSALFVVKPMRLARSRAYQGEIPSQLVVGVKA
jgi:OFA family oxalate/formate antiporter-like MFS transporter